MSPVIVFLGRARRRIERRRALVWTVRGAAASAVGIVLVLLANRRMPGESSRWAWVVASLVLGAVVAVCGWLWARPSLACVARIADKSLNSRERLATALELAEGDAAEEHLLVVRQRGDTEAWIIAADPAEVASERVPRRTLALGSVAALFSVLLVVLPNPQQARSRAAEQAEAARERAADRIATEAKEIAEAAPGEDEGRRQALVSELRRVEEALRDAKDTKDAVAELSRAQENLRPLAGPSSAGRRSAAAGAGSALAEATPAAAAGEALAEVGDPAAQELEDLAGALQGLKPDEQAAMAKELAEAANAAADPGAAEGLRQAAEQLAAGQTAAASQSLAAAARRQDKQRADQAAAKLAELAQDLPTLDPEQQAALARALQQASIAADADPALADSLRQASEALQQGRPAEAASALQVAGKRAQQLGPASALDGDAAKASNQIKIAKDSLLAGQRPGPGQAQSPTAGRDQGQGAEPGQGQGQGKGKGPDRGPGQPSSGQGVSGSGAGEGKGKGSGSGRGEGQSSGGQPGEGQGSGQGQAAGSGSQRGGGAETGGATGALQGPPGQPNEQVYVPGVSGQGRTQALPGEGGGTGTDSPLVPYESVYGEYRAEALSQADRQLVPTRVQDLLRQYFQETPP